MVALTGAPPKPYNFFAKRSTGLSTSNVIDWSGGGWTIDGIMHSNSDINMSGNNNIIKGCYIGVDALGHAGGSVQATGIYITGSNNTIGEAAAAGAR